MSGSIIDAPVELDPTRSHDQDESVETWRSLIGPRLLVGALVAWLWSLIGVDLRAMTDVGLLSVLPSSFFVSLALLTVGFLFVLEHRAEQRLLVAGYLLLLSAMAHATPALLYGTVRYSWSYRHMGVVDFIQRTGGVKPNAQYLEIHHGWPGLFSATAMLSDVTGIDTATIAIWTPFVFSLVSLLALSIVFRGFVSDPRIWSLALWMFIVANWVGQEYFSPQGFTYVLYLSLLAIVIPFDRVTGRDGGRFEFRDSGDFLRGYSANVGASLIGMLIVFSIVASHQFTPIMVVVTFAMLAIFGVARSTWVSVTTLGATLIWLVGPALTYVRDNDREAARTFGSPAESSGASLIDTADVSTGHAIVVVADRFLAEAMVVLAIVGIVAIWRRRQGSELIAALIAAPLVLLFTDFGGEALVRTYLFAVPWIALASAYALTTLVEQRSFAPRLAVRSIVISLLLIAFLLSYLGKERSNYFTPEENDLAAWVYDTAPPNTLLIEGSRNYPGSSRNYENVYNVPISREPDDSLLYMDADPEGTLYRWMTSDQFDASYFILTRSMVNEQESVPTMPPELLERIDTALRASDRFKIVQSNQDGAVFVVDDGGT